MVILYLFKLHNTIDNYLTIDRKFQGQKPRLGLPITIVMNKHIAWRCLTDGTTGGELLTGSDVGEVERSQDQFLRTASLRTTHQHQIQKVACLDG